MKCDIWRMVVVAARIADNLGQATQQKYSHCGVDCCTDVANVGCVAVNKTNCQLCLTAQQWKLSFDGQMFGEPLCI